MEILIQRCDEWKELLTLGLENLDSATDISEGDAFRVAHARGGRVVGLWGDTGAANLTGNGKATVDGKDSGIFIGGGVNLLGTKLQINGNRSSIIVGPGCKLKGVNIIIQGDDCLVAIGANTTWESGAAICEAGQSIIIGDDCMFSSNVIIRVSDGHSMWEKGGSKRISTPKSVVIHPHVWLGNSTRVGKGTSVGMGSIVGQMSLVTGTLGEYSVYGGVPARLLRANVEWSRTLTYEDIPARFHPADDHVQDL